VTCRHNGKVDCVQGIATFLCFQEIKVLQASRPSLRKQLLLNLCQFSILHSKEHDFRCQLHVADVDSASRFCLRKIQTVDVRWS